MNNNNATAESIIRWLRVSEPPEWSGVMLNKAADEMERLLAAALPARAATLQLPEGIVSLTYPNSLSDNDLESLRDWVAVVLRCVERWSES